MGTTVLLVSMFALLLIGVPIGVALGFSIFILLFVEPVTTFEFVAQSFYSGIGSFTLLSLPFFVIAGNIMDGGGISKRIVTFANSLVANVPGSLGIVTIIACMFFGAVSGSAPATAAAIGAIMIPEMIKAGYDKYYATGLVAVAGGLGVIVPPSYPLVVYGVTNNVSISSLFLAGIVPAFVVGFLLMVFNFIWALKRGYKGSGENFSIKRVFTTMWDAKFAILMPVIILGGIYSGAFTTTEAAVVAVVYGIIISKFVYKEMTWEGIWKNFKGSIAFLGGMIYTFAPAAAVGAIFVYLGIPDKISALFLGFSANKIVILLLICLILLIAGMFVQTTPCIVILSPILLPVCHAIGVSTMQFGIIMLLGLCIAFVTPPVAANLFITSSMTGLSMTKIAKTAIPFILGLFIALLLICFIPQLSVGLLDILGIAY